MPRTDEDKLAWWVSVRDLPAFSAETRKRGDVLYGLIIPFQFSKTHAKLERDRFNTKLRQGTKAKGYRLSHRIALSGVKAVARYLKKWPDTVKGKLAQAKRRTKPRRHKERHYGRRHELVIAPRLDRHYRKYGPIGG